MAAGMDFGGSFAELAGDQGMELVYSQRSKFVADLVRMCACHADVQANISFTLLPAAREQEFVGGLEMGPFLPVLFDNELVLEISQPLAIVRHLQAVSKSGRSVGTRGDQLRSDLATELVLRFLRDNAGPPPAAAPGETPAAAMQRRVSQQLVMLSSVLVQRPLNETPAPTEEEGDEPLEHRRMTLTAGDFVAWFFLDVAAKLYGGAFVEASHPVLGQLYAALQSNSVVKAFHESRAASAAAATAAATTATAAAATSAPAKVGSGGAGAASASAVPLAGAGAGAVATPAVAAAVPAATVAPVPANVTAAPAARQAPVAVTGCGGFIATWLVKFLLEKGETVHGTVRSLADAAKLDHLTSLPGAAERLKLFEADLLAPGSFDAAIAGCRGVYHCASPFFFTPKVDAEAELIRPAVEGTRNVLAAAVRTLSVRRVVMTSSVAAVYVSRKPADHFYTEADWSDLEHIRATKQHYAESKFLAEREAWALMANEALPADRRRGGKHPIDLVTVCPTQTIGPLLQPTLNQSCASLLELLDGSKTLIPNKAKCLVDVRDVALCHVLAMDTPTASGRYLTIAGSLSWRTVCDIMRRTLPGARIPSEVEEGPAPHPQALASQKRAHDLGVVFTPLEDSIRDCTLSLFASGFLAAVVPAKGDPRQPPLPQ